MMYSASAAANTRRDSSRTVICPASKGLDPCPCMRGCAQTTGDLGTTYPVSARNMRDSSPRRRAPGGEGDRQQPGPLGGRAHPQVAEMRVQLAMLDAGA